MALTEEQRAEVSELAKKQSLTVSDRGKLEALRHFHDPTSSDHADIDRVLQIPAEPQNATTEADEAAWDEAAIGLDVRIVRALRAEHVDAQHLARAVKFLQPELLASDNVDDLRREASKLRDHIPTLFLDRPRPDAAAGAPSGGSSSSSAQERGKKLAEELGWAKK
jgi:hypothetical protein